MKNEIRLSERACVKVIRNDWLWYAKLGSAHKDWLWYAKLGSAHKDVLQKSLMRDGRSIANC